MQKNKCYYPECMLCCCEDGRHCPNTTERLSKRPGMGLLKGILVGLLIGISIIFIIGHMASLWPEYVVVVVAGSIVSITLILLWLWNQQ